MMTEETVITFMVFGIVTMIVGLALMMIAVGIYMIKEAIRD